MVPVYRHAASVLLMISYALLCAVSSASGQGRDTTFLEGIISSDRTLTQGKVYVVKHNVKITPDATLTIPANTKIYMRHNTNIVVEGGLKMNGGPGAWIEVSSVNPSLPGDGILIRGSQGKDIDIKYTRFSQISVPLKFDTEWFRDNVNVQNNIFTNIFTGEPVIYIFNASQLSAAGGRKATLNFSNNSYISNWGSIYIENFQSDAMDVQFTDNLLTNNVVYAVKQGDPSNALIYGMFDDVHSKYAVKFSGNSIFGNYQINSAVDTIIREVGIGIQGSGESYSIPSNFFRSTDPAYISSTFDHFYQNSSLPLLQVDPIAPSPGESVPPHIWKVKINNKDISTYASLPPLADKDLPFEIYFNKPVEAFGERQIESIVYDTTTNELLVSPLQVKEGQWSPDHKRYAFKVDNASFLNSQVGYIVISNYIDANEQKVPEFTIGQQDAVNNFRRTESGGGMAAGAIVSRPDEFGGLDFEINKGAFLKSKEDVKTLKALTDLGDLSYLGPYETLKKSWEIGFQFGASNYTGTMTDRFTDRKHYHFSGGIYGQYNAHKWFSLRAMLWYGQISGNDLLVSRLATRNRLHNFKNYIIEGSLTFHWHLLPYGTNRGERFVPSIFAGLALFSQNPRSRIFLTLDRAGDPVYLRWSAENNAIATDWENNTDGYNEARDIWVPLQPVGTEGQTAADKTDPEASSSSEDASFFQNRTAPNKYSRIQLAVPIGFEMSWIIRNSWNIGAIFGLRLTTGRYLDDLGGFYFDRINDHQAIVDANTDPNDPSMSTIKARTRKDKGLVLPSQITYVDDQGITKTHYTAALLANPSLVGGGEGANYAWTINEPYDNHEARRSEKDASNYDMYFFAGVRLTKILKRDPKKDEKPKNDAYEKDSDGDGLSDKEEKQLGTNPKKADSDGDGLSDKKEQEQGTKPGVKDSDNDSVPDGKDKCPTIPGLKTADGCPQQ